MTVIFSDIICYFPACLACVFALYKSPRHRLTALVATLINPALIIIDHGHFQYNCISLGFAVSIDGFQKVAFSSLALL